MAAGLALGEEYTLNFKCEGRHGNDRRPGSRKARLVVFEKFQDSSPWQHSNASASFYVLQAGIQEHA
jgi:hypothetical protein